jgi:hypothetical protein
MAFYNTRVGKLYVAQYDLTGFTKEARTPLDRPLRDVTVYGDAGFKGIPGHHQDTFSWRGLFDDGAAGSDVILDALRSATSSQVVTIFHGDSVLGNVGLSSGDMWAEDGLHEAQVGNAVSASFESQLGAAARVKSLGPKQTVTATDNGTSIDDGASSSAGGNWSYHVLTFAASGGNARWQIVLQDSANNSTFATVASESVNITAVGAAFRSFTGTLRRYVRVRWVLDATSGSLEFIAAYERS